MNVSSDSIEDDEGETGNTPASFSTSKEDLLKLGIKT